MKSQRVNQNKAYRQSLHRYLIEKSNKLKDLKISYLKLPRFLKNPRLLQKLTVTKRVDIKINIFIVCNF